MLQSQLLGRQYQDHELKASLSKRERPYFKNKNINKRTRGMVEGAECFASKYVKPWVQFLVPKKKKITC
jgi:hypothetical protein